MLLESWLFAALLVVFSVIVFITIVYCWDRFLRGKPFLGFFGLYSKPYNHLFLFNRRYIFFNGNYSALAICEG